MSQIYVNEPTAQVGVRDGRIEVKHKSGMTTSIPIETAEGLSLFGPVSVSTQCLRECLEHGIDVHYYATTGNYHGKLTSTRHVNVARQRMQARLGDDDGFCLLLCKRIISAKIHNQIVVLRRYARTTGINIDGYVVAMKNAEKKTETCRGREELMGHEGMAARSYYEGLGKMAAADFRFKGRSKRPPLDPFDSMLSLGYTILLYAIYGAIESRGLNPYMGFLHSDREKHPALASDLMEEWRAPIVDSVVMSMVNGHEISIERFHALPGQPGIFLDKDGFRAFVGKLEKRFTARHKYLPYVDYPVSFRRAIGMQAGELSKAIEARDANLYKPIILR